MSSDRPATRKRSKAQRSSGAAASIPSPLDQDRDASTDLVRGPDVESGTMAAELAALVDQIRTCRICRDTPLRDPLPHEPRPVLRPSATARLCICSQAPGTRVHGSGLPFTDPSGDRLRGWLGLTPEEFYDDARVAIVPMGFCFPGHDAAGGDLPPRRECARTWHARLFATMPQLELVLLVGSHAQRWHLRERGRGSMTDVVQGWRSQLAAPTKPRYFPLPHPSWRNNAWLNANSWFARELLPALRCEIRQLLGETSPAGVLSGVSVGDQALGGPPSAPLDRSTSAPRCDRRHPRPPPRPSPTGRPGRNR